jgi:hypothetical protein
LDAEAVGCVVPRVCGTALGDSILVCKRGRFASGVLSVCISPGRFIEMPIGSLNYPRVHLLCDRKNLFVVGALRKQPEVMNATVEH